MMQRLMADAVEIEPATRSRVRLWGTARHQRNSVPRRAPAGENLEMSCPRCASKGMKIVEVHRFQVERCPECHGIFFDGPEIERVLEGRRSTRKDVRERRKVEAKRERDATIVALVAGCTAGYL